MENMQWGRGIPGFFTTDRMTEDVIRYCGIDAMLSYLRKNGYELVTASAEKNIWPNIVAKKDDQLWFIAVATDIAPASGSLEDDEKENLVKHAAKFSAVPAVACVSISSTDPERAEGSLALRDDEFNMSLTSFDVLNK